MPEWLKETLSIILVLGGLECILWMIDRRGVLADRLELKKQTDTLEDILVTLSLKETEKEKEVEPTVHN